MRRLPRWAHVSAQYYQRWCVEPIICPQHHTRFGSSIHTTDAANRILQPAVERGLAARRQNVRVRFAPSPTGELHVGGLRTALYNWLFARRHGGSFILRIEDTDSQRTVDGAADRLQEALQWARIEPDEGPGSGLDSKLGPYIQSKRLQYYAAAADVLLSRGAAYRCFCSPKGQHHNEQVATGEPAPGRGQQQAGCCAGLSSNDVEARLQQGQPYVVRLNVGRCALSAGNSKEISLHDEVRGTLRWNFKDIDDAVLLKSNGWPSYHLAAVVDDTLMGISHVIRGVHVFISCRLVPPKDLIISFDVGEEWLPSAPKHALIYDALGWERPCFVHLPLMQNMDGHKLSKRDGSALPVLHLKQQGYLPSAILHASALCGWDPESSAKLNMSTSNQITTSDGQLDTAAEALTVTEMASIFELGRVQKAAARFSLDKLDSLNSSHIRRLVNTAAGGLPPDATTGARAQAEEACTTLLSLGRVVFADSAETHNAELASKFRDGALDGTLLVLFELMQERVSGSLEQLAAITTYMWSDPPPEASFSMPVKKHPQVLQVQLTFAMELESLSTSVHQSCALTTTNSYPLLTVFRKQQLLTQSLRGQCEMAWQRAMAAYGQKLKRGQVLPQIRLALTGTCAGADVFATAALLGTDTAAQRLRRAAELARSALDTTTR